MTAMMHNGTLRVRSTEEAAALLHCTESWLKEKARRREIPHTLIGGRYGFTDEHIAEIIAQFERRPEDSRPAAAPRRRIAGSSLPASAMTLQARRPRRRSA